MKKLVACICLVAAMLVAGTAFAEMVTVRLGPYTTTGNKPPVSLATNGPVFYHIHGVHSNIDIDFETSVYPWGAGGVAADWVKIETAITANGVGAIAYVGQGFMVDVDAITGTSVYIDLWYERVR